MSAKNIITRDFCNERHRSLEADVSEIKQIVTELRDNHVNHLRRDMDEIINDNRWTRRIASFSIGIASSVFVAFLIKILLGV